MVGNLLLRGMLAGIVAGLIAFAFLKVAGEPQVDRAIAFETQMDEAKAKAAVEDAKAKGLPAPPAYQEEEIVSRPTQAGIGLFTGVMVYNTAFGGLFALAFALCYGRIAPLGPRGTAALIGILGFIAVYAVPNLKYPANPPSVGDPDTISIRTGLYFAAIAISLAGMIAAGILRGRLVERLGAWDATIAAGLGYLALMLAVAHLLPAVNEVPEAFPAVTLWSFRVASAGAQMIMWGTLALVFGRLAAQPVSARRGTPRPIARRA